MGALTSEIRGNAAPGSRLPPGAHRDVFLSAPVVSRLAAHLKVKWGAE